MRVPKKNQNAPRPSECLKKNQNTPRSSEHPPSMGEKMSKRLGGIKGCKYKTSSWHLNRFPDADIIGSKVQCRGETHRYTVYVCVFLPIHSEHQWTYQPGSQEEGHTGFLIHLLSAEHALIFLARRIQPFLSLVDREVEFCVLTILIVLHPLGIFVFVF